MRALLGLMRENGAGLQGNLANWQDLLQRATSSLKILDPGLGNQELVQSVAAELAKVTAFMTENSQRQ